jgi:hypothetical protein
MTAQAKASPDFLSKLEEEARLQAQLHTQRLIPAQLDWLTSLIGNYPWQFLLFFSGLTAVVLEVL